MTNWFKIMFVFFLVVYKCLQFSEYVAARKQSPGFAEKCLFSYIYFLCINNVVIPVLKRTSLHVHNFVISDFVLYKYFFPLAISSTGGTWHGECINFIQNQIQNDVGQFFFLLKLKIVLTSMRSRVRESLGKQVIIYF